MMRSAHFLFLTLTSIAVLVIGEDVLFPFMHGLEYQEYNEAIKLGLSAHVCKDDNEWNSMTTADFAKYKAIIIPDCNCNTSLNTIKFLDDTKKVWSPAVTGNVVLIGTDPSYHIKWYKLPGAYAMMQDSIKLASSGKNGTGMYFSMSCYYQNRPSPVPIESLSEIGSFKVRGNLTCLNSAHIVATDESMTSLDDTMVSNWNCSLHEVFTEYPTTGSGAFEPLAIALNATGSGSRDFADGTAGIPYIIARGATPLGCGNNITDVEYNEECDWGMANGKPGSLCSSSCKCLFGMISPGLCLSNTTSSTSTSSTSIYSSTILTNTSTIPLSTSWPTNSSLTSSVLYTNTSVMHTPTRSRPPTVIITIYPWITTTTPTAMPSPSPDGASSDDNHPVTVTITASPPPPHTMPMPPVDTNSDLATTIVTASGEPGTSSSVSTSATSSASESPSDTVPGTVIVTASWSPVTAPSPQSFSQSNTAPDTILITTSGSPGANPSASQLESNTLPETVIVTASGTPGTTSNSPLQEATTPPGTVFVTASGNPATDSSSTLQASSGLGSWPPSDSMPATVVVTASADPNQSSSQPSTGSAVVPPAGPASSSVASGSNAGTGSPDTSIQSGPVLPPTLTVTAGGPEPSPTAGSSQTSLASTSWGGTKTQVTLTIYPSGFPGSPSGWSTSLISESSQNAVSSSGKPGSPATTITTIASAQSSSGVGGPGTGPSGGSGNGVSSGGDNGPSDGVGTGTGISSIGAGATGTSGLPAASSGQSGSAGGASETVTGSTRGSSETNTADPLGGSSTASGPFPSASSSPSGSVTVWPSYSTSGSPTGNPSGVPFGSSSPNPPSTGTSRTSNSSAPVTSRSLSLPPGITLSTLTSILPTSSASPSSSECDTWIGIEIIHMIEIVEICPSGSTVTETFTSCTETLTRSICSTSTTNHPCYPCIFGTSTTPPQATTSAPISASGDLVTVTVTSCPTLPHTTQTITYQTCSTCPTSIYTGTVPGHTPGECYGCVPATSHTVVIDPLPTTVIDPKPGVTTGGNGPTTTLLSTLTEFGTKTVMLSGCPGKDGCAGTTTRAPDPASTDVSGVGGPDGYGPPGTGPGTAGSGSGGGYPDNGPHLSLTSLAAGSTSRATGGGGAQYTYSPTASVPAVPVVTAGADGKKFLGMFSMGIWMGVVVLVGMVIW